MEKLIGIAIIVGIVLSIAGVEMGRARTRSKGSLAFLIGAGLVLWGLYSAIHSQLS